MSDYHPMPSTTRWLLNAKMSDAKRRLIEAETSNEVDQEAIGRFGDEAPDMRQSLNTYKADYQPRDDWRDYTNPDNCIHNSFLGADVDPKLFKDARRGEVGMGVTKWELAGSRSHTAPFRSVNTWLNCMRKDARPVYAGVVENPSASRGLRDNPRSGSTDGTIVYSGGNVTTYMNSPCVGYAGQSIYCVNESMVARTKDGKVLGSYYKYLGYTRLKGRQIKLFPTLLPMSITCVEHLMNGAMTTYYYQVDAMLRPQNIVASQGKLATFTKQVTEELSQRKYVLVEEIRDWVMLFLLHFTLEAAYFGLTGYVCDRRGTVERAYIDAVKVLYGELGRALNEFYDHLDREAGSRNLSDRPTIAETYKSHGSTPQSAYTANVDSDLRELGALRDDMGQGDKSQPHWNKAAEKVFQMLKAAFMALPTAQNRLVGFFLLQRMGCITTSIAHPSKTVKFISRA